jgi:hypothetical protein
MLKVFFAFLILIGLSAFQAQSHSPFSQFGSRDWSQRIAKYRAQRPSKNLKSSQAAETNQKNNLQEQKTKTEAENDLEKNLNEQ